MRQLRYRHPQVLRSIIPNKGNQELQFPTRYTVTLDGSNLILELTIKFYRRHLSSQPIAKIRAQKRHMKDVMNAIQTLALQIHTIGSFTDALGNQRVYSNGRAGDGCPSTTSCE